MEYDLATTKTFMSRVLQEYVKCGVIGTACDRAGVRRKLHDAWIENYPMYKEKYQEMKEVFIDGLEVTAIERAKEKSDTLLQFLLKANKPDKYGDKSQIEMRGKIAAPITLVFNESMLNENEKKILGGGPDGSISTTEQSDTTSTDK